MTNECSSQLSEELSENLSSIFKDLTLKYTTKSLLTKKLEALVDSNDLQLLSTEECQMLAEFKAFKLVCKPESIFKWQTSPNTTDVVIEPIEHLIRHPQNVS
jgi:hypothetical protein